MKFIALFIFVLSCIRAKITKEMFAEVNEEVLKGDGLLTSVLDPEYAYLFVKAIKPQFSNPFNDIDSVFKRYIYEMFGENKPPGIVSAALETFFCFENGIIDTSDVPNSIVAKRYFHENESRFDNIKIFSTFFLELLKKDEAFKFKQNFIDEQNSVTDKELLGIFNKEKNVEKETLINTLIVLNSFMYEVLDTKKELKEYITNILDHLTDEDKEYMKTTPIYFLKYEKVENESSE